MTSTPKAISRESAYHPCAIQMGLGDNTLISFQLGQRSIKVYAHPQIPSEKEEGLEATGHIYYNYFSPHLYIFGGLRELIWHTIAHVQLHDK